MEDTLPEVEDVLVLFPAQHKAVVRRRDLFVVIPGVWWVSKTALLLFFP